MAISTPGHSHFRPAVANQDSSPTEDFPSLARSSHPTHRHRPKASAQVKGDWDCGRQRLRNARWAAAPAGLSSEGSSRLWSKGNPRDLPCWTNEHVARPRTRERRIKVKTSKGYRCRIIMASGRSVEERKPKRVTRKILWRGLAG